MYKRQNEPFKCGPSHDDSDSDSSDGADNKSLFELTQMGHKRRRKLLNSKKLQHLKRPKSQSECMQLRSKKVVPKKAIPSKKASPSKKAAPSKQASPSKKTTPSNLPSTKKKKRSCYFFNDKEESSKEEFKYDSDEMPEFVKKQEQRISDSISFDDVRQWKFQKDHVFCSYCDENMKPYFNDKTAPRICLLYTSPSPRD